ncbi:MAG: hypothetical protein WDW38_004472 [Sanguina aurantia]
MASVPSAGLKAVVIGAGPAGALASMYLAKRGYQVDVFEKRPAWPQARSPSLQPLMGESGSPDAQASSRSVRTYPMVINMRGVLGLQEVGAQDLPMLQTPMKGVTDNGGVISWEAQKAAPQPQAPMPAKPMSDDENSGHSGFTAAASPSGSSGSSSSSSAESGNLAGAAGEEERGRADPYVTYIVDRIALGQQLVGAAGSLYGDRICFHLGQQLLSVDFDRQSATFGPAQLRSSTAAGSKEEAGGSTAAQTVHYDLLVGADGANSRTRALLQAYDSSLTVETTYESCSKYKTFSGLQVHPDDPPYLPGFHQHKPSEYIYFNRSTVPDLPGGFTFLIVPDGTMSGIVSRVPDWQDPALAETLMEAFPSIPKPWIQHAVGQMEGQETSAFGRNIRCSKLHGKRVVLLGDAGHAVTSMLWQGCNMALDSVRVFNQVLDDTGDNLDLAPALYTKRRLADVHALQHLEFMEIVSKRMACKPVPIYKTAFSLLVLRISSVVRMVMSKLLPSMYPSSSYYDMLKDGSIPYTRVRNAVVSQAVAGMAAMICFVSVMAAAVRFAFVA